MKRDQKLNKANFPPSQQFFLGCWFNMTNISSLDSYRVRTINPQNALEEMSKIFNIAVSNNSDIEMVYSEAKQVLTNDPLLKNIGPFEECISALFEHLKPQSSDKKFQKNCTLTNSLLREAKHFIYNNYIDLCFDFFEKKLVEQQTITEQEKDEIQIVTNNFLSVLINSGTSLDTLFNYYVNILKNNKKTGQVPNFSSRLKLLRRIVTNNENDYKIIFRLEFNSKELIDSFPADIGGISFISQIEGIQSGIAHIDKILKSQYPTLMFAQIKIKAKDERHAGILAYEKIYSVIDLIRFDYITKPINILDEFICISNNASYRFRLLEVDKILQHPSSSFKDNNFERFTSMVAALVENTQISADDKDQIFSAFKFYRIGGDSNINENRIINWWVAIEHLSQSNRTGNGIGEKVINSLLPVMCVSYFRKQLEYVKRELSEVQLSYEDNTINMNEIDLVQLFNLLKQKLFIEALEAQISDEEYVIYKIWHLHQSILSGKDISKSITAHKERLKKQISRIYRARCDIVHSSSSVISLSLLCSNLEYYLKQTLSFILKEVVENPTLKSIEEVLLRANLTYGQLIDTLNKDKFLKFEALLK